ncbi:MAG: hypothetical protein AAB575_04580 [Patescibacteria group bacterium]
MGDLKRLFSKNVPESVRSTVLGHVKGNIIFAITFLTLAVVTLISGITLSSYYQNMGIDDIIALYTLFIIFIFGACLFLWRARKGLKYYHTLPKTPSEQGGNNNG